MPTWAKIIPYLRIKNLKNHTLSCGIYLYSPYMGASPGTRCTGVCSASHGGTSCSRILLVDVFLKDRPDIVQCVYAIIDEQSNSSQISSELADELGVLGLQEKYYLSTCTSEKEVKYGGRVTNVSIQSISRTASDLPTLVECDSILQDKREIPTPEMARRFPHLQEIANEIP